MVGRNSGHAAVQGVSYGVASPGGLSAEALAKEGLVPPDREFWRKDARPALSPELLHPWRKATGVATAPYMDNSALAH